MSNRSLPPRQPRSSASNVKSSSRGRKRARKRSSKSNIGILTVIVAAIVLMGVVVAVQKFAGPNLRVSSADLGLTGLVGDSHKSIYVDFVETLNDFAGVLASIRDQQSAQTATEKLGEIESRLHEINHRAVLIEPIPKQELKQLEKSVEDRFGMSRYRSELDRLNNSSLVSEELDWTLDFLDLDAINTIRMLRSGMAVLPDPRDEFETLARDRVELQREMTRILAGVKSADDVSSVVAKFQEFIPKFEALAERKRQFGRSQQGSLTRADSRYRDYSTDGVILSLLDGLKAKYGELNDLNQAYADLSTAASQYDFALMAGEPSGGTVGNPPPRMTRPGNNPAGASGEDPNLAGPRTGNPRAFAPAGSRPGQPRGPSSSSVVAGESIQILLQGGPFKSASDLNGEEFFAAKKRQREAMHKYVERVKALTETKSSNATLSGGQLRIVLGYTGELQALADHIDFGIVDEINAETHTIVVKMSEDE